MDVKFILAMIILFLAALICAFILWKVIIKLKNKKREIMGSLIINETDPEKDIFRIELNMDLEDIKNQDEIILKIKKEG